VEKRKGAKGCKNRVQDRGFSPDVNKFAESTTDFDNIRTVELTELNEISAKKKLFENLLNLCYFTGLKVAAIYFLC
jgi:hypothetical protein